MSQDLPDVVPLRPSRSLDPPLVSVAPPLLLLSPASPEALLLLGSPDEVRLHQASPARFPLLGSLVRLASHPPDSLLEAPLLDSTRLGGRYWNELMGPAGQG